MKLCALWDGSHCKFMQSKLARAVLAIRRLPSSAKEVVTKIQRHSSNAGWLGMLNNTLGIVAWDREALRSQSDMAQGVMV